MTKLQNNKTYDLEDRTAKFAEDVIKLLRTIKTTPINRRIIPQLVASSGSIGANYCEANESESKKDFVHKIGICKKEIKETKHWLRLLATSDPQIKDEIKVLWKECHELLLIFSKIKISSKRS